MKSCRCPPPTLQYKAVFSLWLNNKLNTAFVLVKSSVFFSLPSLSLSPSQLFIALYHETFFSFCCVDISLLTPWKLKSVSVKVHVSFVKKTVITLLKACFSLIAAFFLLKRSERSESMINFGNMKINNENATWWQVYWENRGFEYAVLAKQLWK